MATGIDRCYEEAAYIAALMEYLIEHKTDHETDAEIVEILNDKPFMTNIIIGVMVSYQERRNERTT